MRQKLAGGNQLRTAVVLDNVDQGKLGTDNWRGYVPIGVGGFYLQADIAMPALIPAAQYWGVTPCPSKEEIVAPP